MAKFTLALYRYFRTHKMGLYGSLIATCLLWIALGLQITYEEDISKLLPSNQIGHSDQHLVFDNLKVKDKIFLLFVPRNEQVSPETLSQVCDAFTDSLLAADQDSCIHNILYRVEENWLFDGISYLYAHLPCYLDSTDYPRIDSLLTDASLQTRMAKNYDDLSSAESLFLGDLIPKDPVALRSLFIDKGKALSQSMGGNYRILDQHLFTPDSTVCVAFLSPNFQAFDSKTGILLTEKIEQCKAVIEEQYPDVEILFHGAPIQGVFNSRQIKHDLSFTLGFSVLLVCLIIAAFFKNKDSLLLLLLPVIYGAFFALACMYLLQGSMSLMAIGIGAIVLGVALSYCLHILAHYKYVSDPEQVLREQTTPVILGSLTTIGAFLGLLFTESALLRDFGLFASFAMVGTTLFCLVYLPHFLHAERNKRNETAFALLEKINSYRLDKSRPWVAGMIVFCLICLLFSHAVSFDTDLKNIGYTNPDVARSSRLLSEKTTHGNLTLYFAVSDHDLNAALVKNEQLELFLDSLKAVHRIQGCSNSSKLLIPTEQQAQRIRLWKQYWTADKVRNLRTRLNRYGAPYGFAKDAWDEFFALLTQDYSPSLLFEDDALPEELLANWGEYTDSTYLIFNPVQIDPQQRRATCDLICAQPGTLVIDPFYYTQDMVQLLTNDFNTVLLISSLFVFLVLLCSFRHLLIALIAFLPMTLSWYVVLGIMGMFGLKFNLINIVISTFVFGVGVDYSIFVMDGLLAGRQGNQQLLVYHKTAIFLSAAVLIISISSLIFATHPAMSSIGLTTLIGMLSTLLITYTLEPWLFYLLQRSFSHKKKK